MKRTNKSGRVWFNPRNLDDTGALSWNVQSSRVEWANAHLTLRDCSRQIILDFSFGDSVEKKARLKKLDLIMDQLTKMRETLVSVRIRKKKT